jgi:DNA-binding MarR family transcriptional regulator
MIGGPNNMTSSRTDETIPRLIKSAYAGARRAVDNAVRQHGVSVAQWGVLARLLVHPGLSGAELARMLAITPQAVQRVLATLERRGLVERKPDPVHGRIVRSYLTPDGRHIVKVAQSSVDAVELRSMSGFTKRDKAALNLLLRCYIDHLPG